MIAVLHLGIESNILVCYPVITTMIIKINRIKVIQAKRNMRSYFEDLIHFSLILYLKIIN